MQVEEELGQKLKTHFRYLSDSREEWSMQSKHKVIGHRARDCEESEKTGVGVGGHSLRFQEAAAQEPSHHSQCLELCSLAHPTTSHPTMYSCRS